MQTVVVRENRGGPWSLASLLAPVSLESFGDAYWGRAPLHVARGSSGFYDGLTSLAELERYFSLGELFGRHTVEAVSRRWGAADGPIQTLGDVNDRLLQGDSLRLRRMECFLDPALPIVALAREMESTLAHPLGSLSCYVTPADACGLGPHHDETEIFTLQIEGTKRWQLFQSVESTTPAMYDRASLGQPAMELTLGPGDLLYLPHGCVHDVISDEPSFSITIVFEPFRWTTVIDALADRLTQVAPLTETIPIGVALGALGPAGFRDQLDRCLDVIRAELDNLDERTLADALARRLLARMTMPPGRAVRDMLRPDRIAPSTLVRRRAEVPCHVARRATNIEIMLPGGQVIAAANDAEQAVRMIIGRVTPFRIADIHPSPSPAAQLSLARTLLGAGLLELVDEPDD